MGILKQLLKEIEDEKLNKILKMPYQQFVDNFKDIASDPAVTAILNAGTTDGKPNDEKIQVVRKFISADDLRPTQNVIGFAQSLDDILTDKFGSLKSMLDGKAKFPTPLVTYNGEYIIDGHHRWSQSYVANPEVKLDCFDLRGKLEPLEMLKVIQLAIAADVGQIKIAAAKGVNLLIATEDEVKTNVMNKLTDNALELFVDKGIGTTKDDVANYIWNNVKNMQKSNAPIQNAPDRTVMPQTDISPNYADILKKGSVNFINPKKKDIK
ncbi:hypothetical protein [Microcystis phage Mel-JY01]